MKIVHSNDQVLVILHVQVLDDMQVVVEVIEISKSDICGLDDSDY